jgi:acetolactate synthase I/III small subunit
MTSTSQHEPADLHILTVTVQNKFGVLARVAGLFGRRGFNIFSLAVAPTDDPAVSRITIVVDVQNTDVTQIAKQLNKLINVLEICELSRSDSIERELMLAHVGGARRVELEETLAVFDAEILEAGEGLVLVSLTDTPDRLDACAVMLREHGIHDLQRTGRIAVSKLSATG